MCPFTTESDLENPKICTSWGEKIYIYRPFHQIIEILNRHLTFAGSLVWMLLKKNHWGRKHDVEAPPFLTGSRPRKKSISVVCGDFSSIHELFVFLIGAFYKSKSILLLRTRRPFNITTYFVFYCFSESKWSRWWRLSRSWSSRERQADGFRLPVSRPPPCAWVGCAGNLPILAAGITSSGLLMVLRHLKMGTINTQDVLNWLNLEFEQHFRKLRSVRDDERTNSLPIAGLAPSDLNDLERPQPSFSFVFLGRLEWFFVSCSIMNNSCLFGTCRYPFATPNEKHLT